MNRSLTCLSAGLSTCKTLLNCKGRPAILSSSSSLSLFLASRQYPLPIVVVQALSSFPTILSLSVIAGNTTLVSSQLSYCIVARPLPLQSAMIAARQIGLQKRAISNQTAASASPETRATRRSDECITSRSLGIMLSTIAANTIRWSSRVLHHAIWRFPLSAGWRRKTCTKKLQGWIDAKEQARTREWVRNLHFCISFASFSSSIEQCASTSLLPASLNWKTCFFIRRGG